MRGIVSLLAGLGLLATFSIDCGGQIEGSPDCPSDVRSACATGARCVERVSDCLGTHELSCACEAGGWRCPELGAPACPVACASARTGDACNVEGASCPGKSPCPESVPDRQLGCTCESGRWNCAMAANCPEPMCPPPSERLGGKPCVGPMRCLGTLICPDARAVQTDFQCEGGRWVQGEAFADPCMAVDPGPVDASPPPTDAGKG